MKHAHPCGCVLYLDSCIAQKTIANDIEKDSKSIRWMPWHKKSMKDVTSCDKLRVGAHNLRSADFRMGEPTWGHAQVPLGEYIAKQEATRGTETSKYPEEEKVNNDSLSSGERKGSSPNQFSTEDWGCGPATCIRMARGRALESATRGGNSPVPESQSELAGTRVPQDT